MFVFLNQMALTVMGVVLFVGAHPGIILKNGLFLFGYLSLVPVFILVKKASLKMLFLWGFLYGFFCYSLFAFWIFKYSPVLFFCAVSFYAVFFCVLFAFMKLCILSSTHEMLVMALIWCACEYVRTLGPLGFSYGVMGYSQWKNPLMLTLSSYCGVWGASCVCAFVAAFVALLCINRKHLKNDVKTYCWYAGACFAFFAVLVACTVLKKDSEQKMIRVLSVQNNADSNKNGIGVYKKDIRTLSSLTDAAFSDSEAVDFVLWPETSVVPPVMYNYYNRVDYERFNAIVDMLHVIARKDACFVIGNQHSEKNADGLFADYNAALVFDSRTQPVLPPSPEVYKKIHLVPFTEYVPKDFLRKISSVQSEWNAGSNYTVFTKRNLCFCTPICFEDTFGSMCRKFILNGAECFFELSNDSWAQSSVCQRQHLSMAVFRSAENHVPAVRSSGSGISCYITAWGKVGANQIKEFSAESAVYSVAVNEKATVYTEFGDWLPVLELCILIWICISKALWFMLKKNEKRNRIGIWQKKK